MKNLEELRTTLLEIHERDRKQTITALIVAETAVLLFLALVAVSLFSSGAQLPPVLYFLFAAIAIGPLVPYIIMLLQAGKRPRRIADFVNRLERGEPVNKIHTYTNYKLILPLRLIRVRLFPMEYVQTIVGQNRINYKLPLSEENVQPFRAFISNTASSTIGGSPSANWSDN
ncbi:hypothetical protein [Chitinophaga sp. MM2321]|uniref:hypothetical protein n=1 Tax=Chitinophaga sp. MM2321 TaxID=3137178 RepID=UPI0032D583E1